MVEKTGELNKIDSLDPVSTAAGAGSDSFVERYADEAGQYEMAADPDDASEKTEQIKAQLEETRINIGETIDAIQDRLSFSNISEQVSEQVSNAIETAKDSVYDATIGKAANYMKNAGNELSQSSIVTAARENPLPFLLIGLGAGLLAYNGFSKKQRRSSLHRLDNSNKLPFSDETSRSMLTSAKAKIGDAKHSVADAAGAAYDGVSNAASTTYTAAGDLAHRAYDKAGEFGTKAKETYNQYLEEKPWAIGAVALVAGAAVGLAIPSTRYEGELMGEARYNLISKAQDTANELVEKARGVATEAGRTIAEETKALTQ